MLLVSNADQGLGVYQSFPRYAVEFFSIMLSNIIRKKFDSLFSEKIDLDFQLHHWDAYRSIHNGVYPLMIVTQLEQEEYNVGENCSAIANVDLTMKKKKLQKKKNLVNRLIFF